MIVGYKINAGEIGEIIYKEKNGSQCNGGSRVLKGLLKASTLIALEVSSLPRMKSIKPLLFTQQFFLLSALLSSRNDVTNKMRTRTRKRHGNKWQ